MNGIVKICKKHGELSKKDIFLDRNSKICRLCHNERTQKWAKKNKDYCNNKVKKWRLSNPEKIKNIKQKHWYNHHMKNIKESRERYQKNNIQRRKESLAKYHNNPKVQSNSRLKRLFGITLEEYNAILVNQKNICAICQKPEKLFNNTKTEIRKLSVDHCHKTKRIRGLLCFNCNIAIGKFQDSIKILENAIEYLTV